MRSRAAAALAAAALAAGLSGCSGGGAATAPAPAPEPTGTGYFVGAGADGVGATLDMHGSDPVAVAVDDALIARGEGAGDEPPAVGIASVVNEGAESVPSPRFVALLADGHGAVPVPRAETVLSAREGPAARRALRLLDRLPARVPAGGAATYYVVLSDLPVAQIGSVRMVVVPGQPITLEARRR